MSIPKALRELEAIRGLTQDIERHLKAGAVEKAHLRAADLQGCFRCLFVLTSELAGMCSHQGDTTEVHGGGETCNKCGEFC